MTNPVSQWRVEHAYFRRLLALLRRELDVFHEAERPDYALIHDILSYLGDYADSFHHPREDVAFERLVRHCPDLRLTLARLRQDHRVISGIGTELLAQVELILEGAIVPRARIEAQIATYLAYYGSHIACEEDVILERAGEVLTAQDWSAVIAAVPPVGDPVFGPDPASRFRNLRHQIAVEAG